MAIETVSDFLSLTEFAVNATWTPFDGSSAQTAAVIFNRPDELDLGQQISTAYEIVFPLSSFVGMQEQDYITIAGVDYVVQEVMVKSIDGAWRSARLGVFPN